MIGETVTVLSPGSTTDGHGNPVPDWDDPDEAEVAGCVFAPEQTPEERSAGRQGVVGAGRLFLPAGAPVAATDRLVVRGQTYEVNGEPGDWRSGFASTLAGVEVSLRRVAG